MASMLTNSAFCSAGNSNVNIKSSYYALYGGFVGGTVCVVSLRLVQEAGGFPYKLTLTSTRSRCERSTWFLRSDQPFKFTF